HCRMFQLHHATGDFLAQRSDMLVESVPGDHAQHSRSRGSTHRVPTERGTVITGAEQLTSTTDTDHRTERQATTESLGEGDYIRNDVSLLKSEPAPGTCDTGLHLVEHEQRPHTRGDLAGCPQITIRRGQHATLAKNRFHQYCGRVGVHRGTQCFRIAVRHVLYPRKQRRERITFRRLS